MSNEDIKKRILKEIKYATETLGYTLVTESWGNAEKKCACAMGCLLVANEVPIGYVSENILHAAQLLEVDMAWIDSFTNGFDHDHSNPIDDISAFDLGVEISESLKPVSNDDFMDKLNGICK